MIDELMQQRIKKLEDLKNEGICLYGGRFPKKHTALWIKENFKENMEVSSAGRIVALRAHGKSIFGDIKDRAEKFSFILKKILWEKTTSLFLKSLM